MTSHGWQQHNRFRNAVTAGGKASEILNVNSSARRNTSEDRKKKAGKAVTGEDGGPNNLREAKECWNKD